MARHRFLREDSEATDRGAWRTCWNRDKMRLEIWDGRLLRISKDGTAPILEEPLERVRLAGLINTAMRTKAPQAPELPLPICTN